jgi:hypothetical protein
VGSESNVWLHRLGLDAATTFALSGSGRILRENDPDRSSGPRLFLAGCREGNLAFARHDVADETARQAATLVEAEPPWMSASDRPMCLPQVIALLGREAAVQRVEASLIYALAPQEVADTAATFVCSGSVEGDALLDHLRQEGMPRHLTEAGFLSLSDFWAPWCVALEGQVIAAIAFAARLGQRGAAVGVYTFPGFRGRGLAAAVTTKWSSLPSLAGRELFYGTTVTNTSSQRVAARLGLPHFGMGLRIT